MLSVGEACSVTKAGDWHHDGQISKVHQDGTYDVYLIDEKITLTSKPQEEVMRATVSREQRLQMDIEEALAELRAPRHAVARAVRLNQSRACCASIVLVVCAFTGLGMWCLVTGFSLRPTGGMHPDGMCELCVWQKYSGVVCKLWPEKSPRCHEHFLPWIYSGAAALTCAIISGIFLVIGKSEALTTLSGSGTLGERSRMTFFETVYPMCDSVFFFRRTAWCCGDEPLPSSGWSDALDEYDRAEDGVRRAQSKILLEGLNRRIERLGML